ncbi:MAG: DsbA family protein [Candidatus Woesearchaeota archaeon]
MAEEDSEKHEQHKHEHKEHEAHKHIYMEHKEHSKHTTYKTATWILGGLCILLLIGLIISLSLKGNSSTTNTGLPPEQVKAQVETYLKSLSNDASVDSIEDKGDLYAVKLTVQGMQYDSYATKDGKLLFPQGIDVTQTVNSTAPAANTQTPTVVPKTDKPVVELFIMSHCPYGTQAEKGILPAVRTLGDKIDFKIRFVYYAMHGELEVKEQLTQYCIQTEQTDKYLKYLACFLNSSDGGSAATSNSCITQTGIDKTKLESCKTAADEEFNVMVNFNDQASWLSGRFPKVDFDKALNEQYGIGGSPTLIINGAESSAGRDSASYLAGICAAFNTAPAECSTVLSNAAPGPGFGYDSTGAATAAGCGV